MPHLSVPSSVPSTACQTASQTERPSSVPNTVPKQCAKQHPYHQSASSQTVRNNVAQKSAEQFSTTACWTVCQKERPNSNVPNRAHQRCAEQCAKLRGPTLCLRNVPFRAPSRQHHGKQRASTVCQAVCPMAYQTASPQTRQAARLNSMPDAATNNAPSQRTGASSEREPARHLSAPVRHLSAPARHRSARRRAISAGKRPLRPKSSSSDILFVQSPLRPNSSSSKVLFVQSPLRPVLFVQSSSSKVLFVQSSSSKSPLRPV